MADFKVYVTDGRHSSYDIERDMLAKIVSASVLMLTPFCWIWLP